jgi:hypothetical protein
LKETRVLEPVNFLYAYRRKVVRLIRLIPISCFTTRSFLITFFSALISINFRMWFRISSRVILFTSFQI